MGPVGPVGLVPVELSAPLEVLAELAGAQAAGVVEAAEPVRAPVMDTPVVQVRRAQDPMERVAVAQVAPEPLVLVVESGGLPPPLKTSVLLHYLRVSNLPELRSSSRELLDLLQAVVLHNSPVDTVHLRKYYSPQSTSASARMLQVVKQGMVAPVQVMGNPVKLFFSR